MEVELLLSVTSQVSHPVWALPFILLHDKSRIIPEGRNQSGFPVTTLKGNMGNFILKSWLNEVSVGKSYEKVNQAR